MTVTMTRKTIQSKWETAVQKISSNMKEALKGIIFSDISNEVFDDNWMISVKVNNKTYHIDYDRKGKSTYSCFAFEKETGINLSDFEEAMKMYDGELSNDLYKAIHTFTPEQKLELSKSIEKLIGYRVKSPRYINGNLELVLDHPTDEQGYTIRLPLESVVISKYNSYK
ncbi:hypothetical protein P4679_22605 [Priestia megaterium]|uniref:hypothetical protein n=1 Tax=Priestia megaterium TaxID=1404 RepID=UPI002E2209BE|nr:hypothetical protein [Priestia megaterium]